MTTGTTVASSASENWETYSDASELEPERDAREMYYSKVHQAQGGKRGGGANGHMAPPAKMRMHTVQRIEEGDENRFMAQQASGEARVDGSDAWSTEAEETC